MTTPRSSLHPAMWIQEHASARVANAPEPRFKWSGTAGRGEPLPNQLYANTLRGIVEGMAGGRTLLRVMVAASAVLLVACDPAPVFEVADWTLTIDGSTGPGISVDLPAQLERYVPSHDLTYRLRTDISIPASLAGHRLRLVVPSLIARVALFADGQLVDPESPSRFDDYFTRGPHAWNLARTTRSDGRVTLELVVEHRWEQSAWIQVTPRLGTLEQPELRGELVEAINLYAAVASVFMLALVAANWFQVYLADRRRRQYLWFATQAVVATLYPIHELGALQRLFGCWDAAVMATAMAVAVSCGGEFTSAHLGLPRPSRRWWWATAIVILAVIGGYDRFAVSRWSAPLLIGFVAISLGVQIAKCVAQMRAHPEDRGARYLFLAWAGLAILATPDFVYFLGWADLAGGARVGAFGIAVACFCVSLIMGQDHTASMRRGDQLNAALAGRVNELERRGNEIVQLNTELQRQIADRSGQLYAALALSVHGGSAGAVTLARGDLVHDRYRVERMLGRGGMGTVYEVTRLQDGRRLALKVAHEAHGVALARLAREAQMAASVHHPNLVSVVDVDVATEGFLYLVMELVEGESLRDKKDQFGDTAWALPLLAQLAEGLAALHGAGIVHRDLKPGNLLLTQGVDATLLKIADFGIALSLDAERRDATDPVCSSADRSPGGPDPLATMKLEVAAPCAVFAEPTPAATAGAPAPTAARTAVARPALPQDASARSPGEPAPNDTAQTAVDRPALPQHAVDRASAPSPGTPAANASMIGSEWREASSAPDRPETPPIAAPHRQQTPATPSKHQMAAGYSPRGGLTKTGHLHGTPHYIAPELARGRTHVAPTADIFALGVIAFEMLTNAHPFRVAPVLLALDRKAPEVAPSLRELWPGAPSALVEAVDSCLHRSPEARPTAQVLAQIFATAAAPGARSSSPARRVLLQR